MTEKFEPRSKALIHLMSGMAFMKTQNPRAALERFNLADAVEGWGEDEGKEILYLWQGTAYLDRALQGVSPSQDFCVSLAVYAESDLDCAERAYQKARNANGDFARGYLGIGKVLLDRVQQKTEFRICEDYIDSATMTLRALEPTATFSLTALVPLKSHLNAGITYRMAYEQPSWANAKCNSSAYSNAKLHLSSAITEYIKIREPSLLAQQLGMRAYYELARLEMLAREFETSLKTIEHSIKIAESMQPNRSVVEEQLRGFQWTARQLRGETLVVMAEAGDATRWDAAKQEFNQIIAAYEKAAKENKTFDLAVVAHAYYQLGRVLYRNAEITQAVEPLSQSLKLVDGVSKSHKSELRFVQHLAWDVPLIQGRVFSDLAQTNSTYWVNSLMAYNRVVVEFEKEEHPINAQITVEAYFGCGWASEQLNRRSEAIEYYKRLLEMAELKTLFPELSRQVEERLRVLAKQD
ncbi:MAG: hypothetical protein HC853_04980 [Anaerolineae bacterium]|nr:hypothetical protein [Anaerolineae bacterium]